MSIDNELKRSKKPMPLFGIFRKTPNTTPVTSPTMANLGSGTAFLPLSSTVTINPFNNDPYSPVIQPQRRQRSKSVGREAYSNQQLLENRELALSKLCKKESTPLSLADSLPLLSPSYSTKMSSYPMPPLPPLPNKKLVKSSSTHDLKRTNKLQQESISQLMDNSPLPKASTSTKIIHSNSLNNNDPNSKTLKTSKSQQQLSTLTHNTKKSTPPPLPISSVSYQFKAHKKIETKVYSDNDDDDDIPLGYLQSPTKKPSSLLSDKEDEDDSDLVPIAISSKSNNIIQNHSVPLNQNHDFQSAADKYKERVKERLNINTEDDLEDDDDIPISLALLSPRWKK